VLSKYTVDQCDPPERIPTLVPRILSELADPDFYFSQGVEGSLLERSRAG
jgi:hypothetical protein